MFNDRKVNHVQSTTTAGLASGLGRQDTPAVSNNGEIAAECRSYTSNLDLLAERISELEGTIAPVLALPYPSEDDRVMPTLASDMGQYLQEQNVRLLNLCSRLATITDRVRL